MRKKILAGVAILLVLLIVILAVTKEPTVYEKLKYNWESTTSSSDSLSLSHDFTFTTNGLFPFEKGVWRLNEEALVLTVDYEQAIDSVAYKVLSNNPELVFFNEKNEIAKSTAKGTVNNQYVVSLKVVNCTLEKLTLDYNGEQLNFKKRVSLAAFTANSDLVFSPKAIFRGLLGMLSLILISLLFSSNRKAVNWKVVGLGLSIQIVLALSILKVAFIASFFEFIGKIFVVVLDFTKEGSVFLLGDLMNTGNYGFIFAFQVLPTIIFFSALTSLLFYLGIIQKVVFGLAWVMTKALKISGAESLSVAGNIFLGQTESPLLVKAYLEKMNRSEIMLVMSGGMATLAGGVLAAYIAFLGGDDPVQRLYFAKHLLAASIMAAPGVVVIAKIIVPQTEEINTDVEVSKEKIGSNVLDAISNGTSEGLKLAVNVGAMLLTFIAFIAMLNFILLKVGSWTSLNELVHTLDPQYNELSLKFILGYLFAPIVWLMGVAKEDVTLVGRLIGEKLILTEFIAYVSLAELKAASAFFSDKSVLMSTYALCGFANFASIGIQIGGIGSLAPGKRKQLSELGMRALLAGSLASLLSATIVGMILG